LQALSLIEIVVRPGNPDFLSFPWHLPLQSWQADGVLLEDLPAGHSRHPVIFINENDQIFALKELPNGAAQREYQALLKMENQRLPCVQPVGYARTKTRNGPASVLITRYLDYSLPFLALFTGDRMISYRAHLLDAIAGLMVQLHLAGVYWGDCSLSNTLFKRDAGALRAYLVDAETVELHSPEDIPPALRHQDLVIMEENINGDLADLGAEIYLPNQIYLTAAGSYLRLRYQRLWEEITQEHVINPNEHYRIQERIRALNDLGFSVGDVELFNTGAGDQLRLRVMVTDQNFHRDQLQSLTGIEAGERQARKIMNEIFEIKATLSREHNRSMPLSVAAHHWLQNIYQPTLELLKLLVRPDLDTVELYCQLLEHKWYLSEQAQHDVGHQAACSDYLARFQSF
jgi:hypothetical protein